jgi:ferredoxin
MYTHFCSPRGLNSGLRSVLLDPHPQSFGFLCFLDMASLPMFILCKEKIDNFDSVNSFKNIFWVPYLSYSIFYLYLFILGFVNQLSQKKVYLANVEKQSTCLLCGLCVRDCHREEGNAWVVTRSDNFQCKAVILNLVK